MTHFMVRGYLRLAQPPTAKGPPIVGCRLTQYIRSYAPYCRQFLHPQPEDTPYRGDRDPQTRPSNKLGTIIHDGEKGTFMLLYVAPLGDRNVIKK